MTERKAPTRPCPSCGKVNHVRVLKCECGKVLRESQPQEQKTKPEEKTETEIKTTSVLNPHDFPGRGKTQCPSCKKYIGAKLTNCNLCNALLRPDKDIVQEVKVSSGPTKKFDGPGPGRKQCSSCKSYVGVRTLKCECGFEFGGKKDSGLEKVNPEGKSPDTPKGVVVPPAPKSRPSTSFVNIPTTPSFLSLAKKAPKEEKEKPAKEQVFFFKEGQGKKFCPGCTKNDGKNIYVPVATRNCGRCGFFFEKKEKSEPFKRQELPEQLGNFIFYTKEQPTSNSVCANLEYQEREYYLFITGDNLSCEEMDAELSLFNETEGLNNKHPNEVTAFLTSLFKLTPANIRWQWVLNDEKFEQEQRLPIYLRYSLRNKKYNNTKKMWEHFCVSRDEYLRSKQFSCAQLNTPKYYHQGNKLVLMR